MKNLFFSFVLICFFFLQVTALHNFEVQHVKLDLLFIFVFLASVYLEQTPAILLSLASGFLKDLAGIEGFGIHLLLFPLWSFLIIKLSKRIVLEHFLFASLAMGVISFLNAMLIGLFLHLYGTFISWPTLFRISTLESFYTAALLPFVLLLVATLRLESPPKAGQIEEGPL